MHREGANPDDMAIEDVLCDFCGVAAWAKEIPCVEGHRGSLICGDCLAEAWCAHGDGALTPPASVPCTMCLEEREDPLWRGSRDQACICLRCIKQAAGALHKSRDWNWVKPNP